MIPRSERERLYICMKYCSLHDPMPRRGMNLGVSLGYMYKRRQGFYARPSQGMGDIASSEIEVKLDDDYMLGARASGPSSLLSQS